MNSGTSCEKDLFQKLYSADSLVQEQLIVPPVKRKKPIVIVISGPTCCGKSALGMMLAETIGGDILTADSVQVYKGMDIGTAKPSLKEMELVPHHLIDIRNVWEAFNVVDFYYEAKHCLEMIHSQGRIPIVVGGSGFYIHALLYGPPSGPPSVPEIRKKFEEQFEQLGADEMYERLMQFDSDYAKTISCHDRQKIIRGLEIIDITGDKVSRHNWKSRLVPKGYDFRCWFLNRPRSTLYHRIEQRCDKMLAHGLLEEVDRLEDEGLRENSSASQAIGYRQSLDFLSSKRTREDYLVFVAEFKKASRRYAKRQLTWFRRESLFNWLDLDLHDPETAMDLILNDLDSR
ncbi:MAG: tRNA dimethylallyltransferase [Chlamydiae bacterium]|nr:tRNA dimethylallyltransferase [Chlamydiota bacterium]